MTERVNVNLVGKCVSNRCVSYAGGWSAWAQKAFKRYDPAMIDVVHGNYSELVGRDGRYMINKAEKRGITYGYFEFNDQLDAMHAIDTSKPERQGMQMTESYRKPHKPIAYSGDGCWHHDQFYIGGFHRGELVAYCFLVACGEAAIMNRFIGHAKALQDGVMNGLIAKLVVEARYHHCRFLNYLTMESKTEGLTNFKRNVGFSSTKVRFML